MNSIKLEQPYDLEGTLYSGQSFRWNPVQETTPQVPIWHEGVIYGRRIQLTSEMTKGYISIKGDPDPYLQNLVADYLRIEDNLNMIYKAIGSDHLVRSAIRRYRGLHLLRQDPWECLITFICSANNNIPRIKLLAERISKAAGSKITDEPGDLFSFPNPTQLSELKEPHLRDIGLGFRAKYIAQTTTIIFRNNINLLDLRKASFDQALDFLNTLPGVGDKIANCVLLFSLDKLEAFPIDVWIQRVLRERYLPTSNTNVPNSKLRSWAQDRFGPFSGYVNQYLFHSRRLAGSKSQGKEKKI